jgi:membrane-bound serine protease (ClpP class)
MNFLLDPNVAYLILVIGVILGMLALFTPGTGLLEVGALFAIFLAGYAMVHLPIRLWALILLVVGIVPFFFALRKFKTWYWLVPAILSAVLGSVFLFKSETNLTAINPLFATLVSIISIVLMWFIGIKTLEALRLRPSQDLSRLMDVIGEARTDIFNEGTVYAGGEDWTARSDALIPAGSQVKVVGREGLVLKVVKAE